MKQFVDIREYIGMDRSLPSYVPLINGKYKTIKQLELNKNYIVTDDNGTERLMLQFHTETDYLNALDIYNRYN